MNDENHACASCTLSTGRPPIDDCETTSDASSCWPQLPIVAADGEWSAKIGARRSSRRSAALGRIHISSVSARAAASSGSSGSAVRSDVSAAVVRSADMPTPTPPRQRLAVGGSRTRSPA